MTRGQTTAAVLTPSGRGAVAVTAVLGPEAMWIVSHCFTPATKTPLAKRPAGSIVFGRWTSADSLEQSAGEEVVITIHAVDHLEVHCHGGQAAVTAVAQSLQKAGVTMQPADELLPHLSQNRLQAEAWKAASSASTERAAACLLDQYRGALQTALEELIQLLDDQQLQQAAERIAELLQRGAWGTRLTSGWKVVLAGPPNVGKSSLINAILGYERAIVFDQPGTTRDVVSATAAIDGWPVELSDTAGLREASDLIEQAGVQKALHQAATADLVLHVHDASTDEPPPQSLLPAASTLALWNKSDLITEQQQLPGRIYVSAQTGAGLPQLLTEISKRLIPSPPQPGEATPFLTHHLEALRQAERHVEQADTAAAMAAIRSILNPRG